MLKIIVVELFIEDLVSFDKDSNIDEISGNNKIGRDKSQITSAKSNNIIKSDFSTKFKYTI